MMANFILSIFYLSLSVDSYYQLYYLTASVAVLLTYRRLLACVASCACVSVVSVTSLGGT